MSSSRRCAAVSGGDPNELCIMAWFVPRRLAPRRPCIVLALTALLASSPGLARADSNPFDSPVPVLREGDLAPATQLVDQRGALVRLSDFRGQAVALGFIYTSCTDECPLITRKFARLAGELAVGPYHLVEASVDPVRDTPAAIAAYARTYGAATERWSIVTSGPETLARFDREFGIETVDQGDGKIVHNDRLLVIGPDGRIARIIDDPTWTPGDVAQELKHAAGLPSNPIARLNVALSRAVTLCGSFLSGHSGLVDLVAIVAIFTSFGFALYWVRRKLFASGVESGR